MKYNFFWNGVIIIQLNHLQVREILEKKGITHLYHANTTKTACTFINSGGVSSRGAVEHYGLEQTPQTSDSIDKQYNVWNDIFLDSIDLHKKFQRQNFYGPILFKYSLDILNQNYQLPLWVTKNNPVHWMLNQTDKERYMQDLEEFEAIYANGSFKEMITFRNTHSYIPFIPFLEEVVIDDPKLYWTDSGAILFEEAADLIRTSMETSLHDYSNVKLTRRECTTCYCESNYNNLSAEKLKLLFSV